MWYIQSFNSVMSQITKINSFILFFHVCFTEMNPGCLYYKKQTFFPLSVSMICHIVTHKSFLWDKFDFFFPYKYNHIFTQMESWLIKM